MRPVLALPVVAEARTSIALHFGPASARDSSDGTVQWQMARRTYLEANIACSRSIRARSMQQYETTASWNTTIWIQHTDPEPECRCWEETANTDKDGLV